MFKIKENILLETVNEKKGKTFFEAVNTDNSFIIPRILAMPLGKMTRNGTIYDKEYFLCSIPHPENGQPSGLVSFVKPYFKPVLTNHDMKSEPLGRIIYGEVREGQNDDVILYPMITDKDAIEKIVDGRYLTVSIGIETDHVWCTICGNDMTTGRCEHQLMHNYDGKMCGWEIGNIWAEEMSFVNNPSAVAYVEDPNVDKNYIENKVGNISYFIFNMDSQEAYYKSPTRTINVSENVNFNLLTEVIMKKKEFKQEDLPVIEDKEEIISTSDLEEKEDVNEKKEEKEDADEEKQEESKAGEFIDEKKWDRAFIDSLPDAAFAVVKKPVKNKATDRALPHHNENVKTGTENSTVDLPHLRNALARFEQVDWSVFGEAAKAKAKAHLIAHAKALKVGDYAESMEIDIDLKAVVENLEAELEEKNKKISALEASYNQILDEVKELKDENMFLAAGLHKSNTERLVDLKVALNMIDATEWETEFEKYLSKTTQEIVDILSEYSEEYLKKSKSGSTKPVIAEKSVVVPTEEKSVEESAEVSEEDAKELVVKTLKGLIQGKKIIKSEVR